MATYDFYFQGKKPEDVNGFKFFTSGFDRSVAVRGVQKLVLNWIKRFMTTKGSDPTRPDEGTEFPNLIGSNITSLTDVRDIVLLAIQDCNDQIQVIQRTTQPDDDEQLLTAVLTSFALDGADGFEAWVTISNVPGDEITVPLPDLSTRQ